MKSLAILLTITAMYSCCAEGVTIQSLTPSMGLTEGPHWDSQVQRPYFVSIMDKKMCSYNTTTRITNCATIKNGPIGVAVPVDGAENKFVVGSGRDVLLVTWDGMSNTTNPTIQKLASLDADRNDTRINDGKVDSKGRLWIGTMGPEKNGVATPNRGSLYMMGSDLRPQKKISPVTISNGLAWSNEDDTMYYIDSPTYQIVAYNFTPSTGTISNKRVVFDIKRNNIRGAPDGMTIDTRGNLWVALYGGGRIIQVDPKQGKLLSSVELPAERVTSVAFGGPQLDTLYVTTSSFGMRSAEKQKQPQAGSVFAVTALNVKGRMANTFKMQ